MTTELSQPGEIPGLAGQGSGGGVVRMQVFRVVCQNEARAMAADQQGQLFPGFDRGDHAPVGQIEVVAQGQA